MDRNFSLSLVYILLICLEFITSQTFIGDYCALQRSHKPGECQLLENCLPAIQELQKGNYPQTCGFQANQPIVCCPQGSGGPDPIATPSTTSTTKSTTTRSTTKSTTKPTPRVVATKKPVSTKVGDKANQKCAEYGQYVNVVEKPPVNIPGVEPYVRADCGVVEVPLIVGGEIAKPKEFPHMALIGFQGDNNQKLWYCGGSLISKEFVLTAAHCLLPREFGEPKYIRLGDLDYSKNTDNAKPQDFTIKSMHKHPLFKPPSQYNDIALLRMDREANLNPYVRPICLNTNTKLTTKRAISSGWGRVNYTSDVSSQLLKVTLEYFSHAECNNSYRSNIGSKLRYGIVPDTQVCAGSHSEAKDSCQGDSGGPLQIYNGKQVYCTYKIVGVTSFGKSCGLINIPGVYTLVSPYIKWIENIVWP